MSTAETGAMHRGRILKLLTAARRDWVPLPKIAACAVRYNARQHELRHLGFHTQAPRIGVLNGQRRTWRRIEQEPTVRTTKSSLRRDELLPEATMFLMPELWRDPEEGGHR
jgi:hypothetical protein